MRRLNPLLLGLLLIGLWYSNFFFRSLILWSLGVGSTLAWKIPWTEEPGRLQSMGSLGVRHDWATSLSLFTFFFPALEKEMATHSSVLAQRIPGTGEPGGLPSLGSRKVGHDWSDSAAAAAASQICHSVPSDLDKRDYCPRLHTSASLCVTQDLTVSPGTAPTAAQNLHHSGPTNTLLYISFVYHQNKVTTSEWHAPLWAVTADVRDEH